MVYVYQAIKQSMGESSKTVRYFRSQASPLEELSEPYKDSDMVVMRLRLVVIISRCSVAVKEAPRDPIIEKMKLAIQKLILVPHWSRFKQNPGASRKVIRDSLETHGESSSCVICMEEFATVGTHRMVTRLPCLHLFHGHCIFRWLKATSPMCPLCRYAMPHVYVLSYMFFTHDDIPI